MIVPLRPDHADGCVEVLRSLPEWFGYPRALGSVRDAAATQEGFVYLDGTRVVGLITTKPSYDECLEITFLAVHATKRHLGIGRQLVYKVRDMANERQIPAICLLTFVPSEEDPLYYETVSFYRALGFWRTKELYLANWHGLLMTAAVVNLPSS